YIQVDESTLRVIDNEKGRALKGYVWVVRDAIEGNVFFHYDKGSRSNATAKALLGNYRGAIQSDGYVSYNQFESSPGKMLLGCLVHARRAFVNALNNDKQKATEGIMFFSKLYEIEKQAKENNLSAQELTKLRKEKAYPILQLFEKWLISNSSKVLASSPIGKAIHYSYTLLPRLSRYVNDGRYNPDNNLIESVIRPLAVGRKNWLQAGSTASAIRATMMYSFIGTCKAFDVNPTEWFRYV
ncbi:MAG: IS66 family transposase, partial [Bacteroidales bacterium]